jgi:hypothetical protein
MSYYYQYKFTSPEPLYALIREELKSYFSTGAVDDLLFPTWTDQCLRDLGRSSYQIKEKILHLEDYQAKLPASFNAVRELWLCSAAMDSMTIQSPNSKYIEVVQENFKISSTADIECAPCSDCAPEIIRAVYKQNQSVVITDYAKGVLLRPGNVSTRQQCSTDCMNYGSSALESFDIHGNKLTTNIREGLLYLVYYAEENLDGIGLIPDNRQIEKFIENHIKFKIFEMLSNQITDETHAQMERKKQEYEAKRDEAYVGAETEVKKETIDQKMIRYKKTRNKFNKYTVRGDNNGHRR